MNVFRLVLMGALLTAGCVGTVNVNNPTVNADVSAQVGVSANGAIPNPSKDTNTAASVTDSVVISNPSAPMTIGTLGPLIPASPTPTPVVPLADFRLSGLVVGGTSSELSLILTFTQPVVNCDFPELYVIDAGPYVGSGIKGDTAAIESQPGIHLWNAPRPIKLTNLSREISGNQTNNITIRLKPNAIIFDGEDTFDLTVGIVSAYPSRTLKDDHDRSLVLDGVSNMARGRVPIDVLTRATPSPGPVNTPTPTPTPTPVPTATPSPTGTPTPAIH